ncbi:hypothetical protein [Cohnella caldifontis]|uniref:hypothetical protein n=1 Tax=Cohnella caldifontis TaxID=3027471 RepID=UPI0023ECC004|nr:hypothetical protein [Cohnella sp. YIM B05605]
MTRDKSERLPRSFLFQVDILIQADSNGEALERLLHVLNEGHFADYRIGSGIQLGQAIEEALQANKKKTEAAPAEAVPETDALKAKHASSPSKPGTTAAPAAKTQAALTPSGALDDRIRQYIESNKLIRLNVNKGRGIKLSIPCRIVGYDAAVQMLTVYHVDEKQVHTFKLNEIDDFLD